MIRKIDHIVITTSHETECLDFYEKLGFKVRDAFGRYELYAGDFKINVHLKGKELFPHAGQVQTGSADICLEITDKLEVFRQRLLEKGLTIEVDSLPRYGVRGQMNSLYLRDPDGNLIEFCSYK